MKIYINAVILLAVSTSIFGYAVPQLISASSTILVILGMLLTISFPPVVYYYIKHLAKSKQPLQEKI